MVSVELELPMIRLTGNAVTPAEFHNYSVGSVSRAGMLSLFIEFSAIREE